MIEIVGPRLTSATHRQEQGGKDIAVNRTNIQTRVFSPAGVIYNFNLFSLFSY